MAHNLNFNLKRQSYSFAGTKPAWHGLGTIVKEAMTSEEAIKLANLDFEVQLAQKVALVKEIRKDETLQYNTVIKTNLPQYGLTYHKGILVPDTYFTFRTDTNDILGEVLSRYTVVQNTQAFDFFDNIIQSKQAIFETAGCLGKGETIFITVKLPNSFTIGKDDLIDKYLLFTNTHDGSGSIRILFTPIRVVCNNTLQAALSGATNVITLRHTANIAKKLEMAQSALGLANVNFMQLEVAFNKMTEVKLTDKEFTEKVLTPFLTKKELELLISNNGDYETIHEFSTKKKNILRDIEEYAYVGIGQEMQSTKGTAFGVFNAVTGYFNNVKQYRNGNAGKFSSVFIGEDLKVIQKAFEVCI